MVMNDMTDDGKWGAEIAVDGVRPEWLDKNQPFRWNGAPNHVPFWGRNEYVTPDTFNRHSWSWITAIRLPADHPHYQQTQTIDWSAPIEALYEGKWVTAHVGEHDTRKETQYPYRLEYGPFTDQWFTADGKHCISSDTIRNVQPATQTQPQTLTAQERLERLENLAKRIASTGMPGEIGDEARALVAEMEPVDPDLIEARQIEHNILVEHEMDGTPALRGEWDDKPGVRGVLRAIKRGRELQAELMGEG